MILYVCVCVCVCVCVYSALEMRPSDFSLRKALCFASREIFQYWATLFKWILKFPLNKSKEMFLWSQTKNLLLFKDYV